MSGKLRRVKMFVGYIWSDFFSRAVLSILAFVGFMQAIGPLLMQEQSEGQMTLWERVLALFVTRWPLPILVIVLLSAFLLISIWSLWKLGGFDLRIGLQLQSEPLTDGDRRFLGLRITNLSPTDIRQLFVRMEGLRRLDDEAWRPNPLVERRDKFWWTSWEPPRQGTKTLVPGYEIISDILVMKKELGIAVFLLQAQNLYLFVEPGTYRVDVSVVGVYSNRRFEIPMSFELEYSGGMNISNVRPAEGIKQDWRIEGQVGVSVLPPPPIEETQKLHELLSELEENDEDKDDGDDD